MDEYLASIYDYMSPDDVMYAYGCDLSELDYSLILGNINRKAITTFYDRVSFNYDNAVPLNELVELSADNGAEIMYSLDGTNYQVYTEPFDKSLWKGVWGRTFLQKGLPQQATIILQ